MTPEEKQAAQAQPFPIVDPPQVRLNSADIPPEYMDGVMTNAGISKGDAATPSYAQQTAQFIAHTDAKREDFVAHNQATQIQAGMIGQVAGPEPTVDPSAANPDAATEGTPQDAPVNSGSTESQGGSPTPTDPQQPTQPEQAPQRPPMHPNPEQRLQEIQSKYEVDPDTAMGVLAAEDHGVPPEQYLQFLTQGASV